METIEEKIDRFRRYNRTLIAAAFAKSNRRHQGLPAKLLLCSIFDSLSIAAFPNAGEVGKRYKDTVNLHSGWVHHDRVSLLQLCHVLDSIPQVPQTFSQLYHWAHSEKKRRFPISNSLISKHKNLSADPTYQEVLKEWPHKSNGNPEELGGHCPDKFTHRNLLWKYRNKLAHEFRLPGEGAQSPFRLEFEAYYTEVAKITGIDSDNGFIFSNQWELIYPTGLFFEITKKALESICTEYRKKGSSPFLNYQEGSSWL